MKRIYFFIFAILMALVGGLSALHIYTNYIEKPKIVTVTQPQAVQYANYAGAGELPDLTYAAEQSVQGVVHIQTQFQYEGMTSSGNPLFDFFFGDRYQFEEPQMQQATGSGVIISTDGYIVTNNHVIERAKAIKVTLHDNREFEAKLIGTDPSTDIALLKIDGTSLPSLTFGDSDALKLGQWVLAVGNPFNLNSTVTAGIVSAKARGIGIIGGQMPIESFIQTDAAVNPGNSGGALVNTSGELVGINTAIASRTGSFSGYSFAVPVSIVKKVVEDLKEYGEVQRAVMGINIQTINAELAKELNMDKVEGVYIAGVVSDGAADQAGIKEGDVVVSIEGIRVNSTSELQEQVSRYRPGKEIQVVVNRKNKEKLFNVTLRNAQGGTGVVKNSLVVLGAQLEPVDDSMMQKLRIRNGLEVKALENGKLKEAGVKKGFIITHVNKHAVSTVEEIKEILKNIRGGVLVEGKYQNGDDAYYVFGLN